MDYDPSVISYEQLLEMFWNAHSPTWPSWSIQYMSAIFYHNENQKLLAEKSMEERSTKLGKPLYTKILPYKIFHLAEDYHQKYYLRKFLGPIGSSNMLNIQSEQELIDSPIATKLNGYAARKADKQVILNYINGLSISDTQKKDFITKIFYDGKKKI